MTARPVSSADRRQVALGAGVKNSIAGNETVFSRDRGGEVDYRNQQAVRFTSWSGLVLTSGRAGTRLMRCAEVSRFLLASRIVQLGEVSCGRHLGRCSVVRLVGSEGISSHR
jgi:hypothetical protein